MPMTEREKNEFRKEFDVVVANLLKATGLRNNSQLGYWLWKEDSRKAEMYIAQVRHQCFQNYYGLVIKRCIEHGINLNVIFGNGEVAADHDELLTKYKNIESQVKELLKQNGILLSENQGLSAEFRKISGTSQELMLKYMELVNKGNDKAAPSKKTVNGR